MTNKDSSQRSLPDRRLAGRPLGGKRCGVGDSNTTSALLSPNVILIAFLLFGSIHRGSVG